MAAKVDIKEGELSILAEEDAGSSAVAVEQMVYAQPVLKESCDERCPQPYRRRQRNCETDGSSELQVVNLESGEVASEASSDSPHHFL